MRRAFVLLVCGALTFGALGGAWAQAEDVVKEARILRVILHIDDGCGFLSRTERDILNRVLKIRLDGSGLTDDVKKQIVEAPDFKPDCNSSTNRGFINIGKELVARITERAAGGPTPPAMPLSGPARCDTELAKVRAALDKIFDASPAGALSDFDGCWTGALPEKWQLRLCSAQGGTRTTATLSRPDENVSCQFSGTARPRQDGAFFAGYSDSLKCSNGLRAEHIEGFCTPIAGKRSKCLVSAYTCGLETLGVAGDFANGNVTLERTGN